MLELYLLRHADALPPVGASEAADCQRPLSQRGLAQLAALRQRREPLLQRTQHWLVSPLLRTQQTAAQLRPADSSLKLCERLTPDSRCKEAIAAIDTLLAPHLVGGLPVSAVVVTHMPLIGDLIEQLSGQRIAVPTAALSLIKFDLFAPQLGTLMWSDSQ